MTDDVFTEVSHQSWLGRIGGAVVGVLFGGVLLLVAVAVLFWNEGRAVHRASDIGEFAAAAVTVDPAAPNPAADGKPVHFTGQAVGGSLADPVFGVRQDGIHLRRVVEMFQWDEDKTTRKRRKALGGGEETVTEYKYRTRWSEKLIDSRRFNSTYRDRHQNPPAMRVEPATFTAPAVTVGAFALPKFLADEIDNAQPVPVTQAAVDALPPDLRDGAAARDGKVYLPAGATSATGGSATKSAAATMPLWGLAVDPANPRVGDCRVTFKLVPAGPVSVVAVQRGTTLDAFHAGHGDVARALPGTHTLPQMVAALNRENSVLTWVLRAVGWLVMFVALVLVLAPLKVLADVVGIIGDVVGAGVFLVALAGSVVLSVGTIATAWVFYRPVLGFALFAVAGVGLWWLGRLKRTGHARYVARHPAPAGPPGYTGGPGPAFAGVPAFGGAPAYAGVPGVPADQPPAYPPAAYPPPAYGQAAYAPPGYPQPAYPQASYPHGVGSHGAYSHGAYSSPAGTMAPPPPIPSTYGAVVPPAYDVPGMPPPLPAAEPPAIGAAAPPVPHGRAV